MKVSGTAGRVIVAAALACGVAQYAEARQQDPAAAAPAPAQAEPSDRAVNPSQPDFTVITLPTTLRMPKFAGAFRVTHRFTRSLGDGDFGDLLGDAFGVDGSAQIGLEFRFGIMSGTQVGIHRTSERTIQLFLQHQLLRQKEGMPVTIDALGAIDGTNNFRDSYSPSVGAVISHTFGRHGAAYVVPIWINNTNQLPSEVVDDNNTFVVGVGGRVRVRPTLYLLAEAVPRVGYTPNKTQLSFAIEKRAGGHSFQINFSNGFGTTLDQIARGGIDYDTWFLGFNISRKFF
jgi:Membrane bound beta barrel domain (DUF5777)